LPREKECWGFCFIEKAELNKKSSESIRNAVPKYELRKGAVGRSQHGEKKGRAFFSNWKRKIGPPACEENGEGIAHRSFKIVAAGRNGGLRNEKETSLKKKKKDPFSQKRGGKDRRRRLVYIVRPKEIRHPKKGKKRTSHLPPKKSQLLGGEGENRK